MRAVGIKELKNRLSEFVRVAAGGETVLVLDRDRVVAELVPPAPARPLRPDEAWKAKGIREGWLRPAFIERKGPPKRVPSVPFDQLMAELEKDRADK